MAIKDLLPIGSIVILKDGEKKLMIAGVKQMDANGNGTEYDYMGVLYPEGHIGELQYLFNHEDIAETFFMGYADEERAEFINKLAAYYNEN